jgi:hypothetical protein
MNIIIKFFFTVVILFHFYSCSENEGNITFLNFKVGSKEYNATAFFGGFDQGNYARLIDTSGYNYNELNGFIDLENYYTYRILLSDDLLSVRNITFYGTSYNGGFCCEDGVIQNSSGTSVVLNITHNDNSPEGYIAGTFNGSVKALDYGGFSYASFCTGNFLPINGSFRLKIK